MTGKVQYSITIKTPAISESQYGLEFGKQWVNVDSNEILNERPINPENFTDGVLQNFAHSESPKHVSISPNFMIRQGRLVKSKISGISIVGSSEQTTADGVKNIGEYKSIKSKYQTFV